MACGMALAALLLGWALELSDGFYNPRALLVVTLAVVVSIAAVTFRRVALPAFLSTRVLVGALAICVLLQVRQLFVDYTLTRVVAWGAVVIALPGLLNVFDVRKLRLPLIALASIAFFIVGSQAVLLYWPNPRIDVFLFQQMGAASLLHGQNPYAVRFPNLYPPATRFYGPGVVDANNQLTFGFPYPPLGLLMVLPGYIVAGDCRLVDCFAVAATAVLMVAARPGRWAALVSLLFLLTPRVFFVVRFSWTEALLALSFSLVMFCALRLRSAMPYALGLLFATKQYTVLAVPLVWLLLDEPRSLKQLTSTLIKAGGVACLIIVPFFLWNPDEFWRAVVQWQFLQPFREDALSYLVWFRGHFPRLPVPSWSAFVMVVPAIAFALRRCPRSPGGFAAAVTIVHVFFFAFNKQAFCNYYYFVIAAAAWTAVAAGTAETDELLEPSGPSRSRRRAAIA